MPIWTQHGDGRTVEPGAVVNRTSGWLARDDRDRRQHVVAMFGATFLVPLSRLPVSTTLLFSGVGRSCSCC
jgi:NCS2 family nucleobase:cation symporter-2